MGYSTFLLIYVLGCMVLNQSYESNLKSHLTTEIQPPPITSFEELADFPFKDLIFINPFVGQINNLIEGSTKNGRSGLEKLKGTEKRAIPPPANMKKFSDVYLEVKKGHAVISAKAALDVEIRRQFTNEYV